MTTATISLEQDPVIRLHDTPTDLIVEVNVPFSLQIHAAHILPYSQSLIYHLYTSPHSLLTHISIDHLGEVTGVIPIDTIPDILTAGGANITVEVSNEFGSSLNVTIPLLIAPTPPLPLDTNLVFTVAENHTTAVHLHQLTTLTLVDPNGDLISVPVMNWYGSTFELYPFGGEEVWWWTGRLYVDQTQLDYETRSSYTLTLNVTDSVNSSLTTSLTIHVTITSQNEHTPSFINFK